MNEKFEFRNIFPEEADQAALIEKICFPPNEACSEAMMKERAVMLPDLFWVAVDKETGRIAGFLNGIAESSWDGERWYEMCYDLKVRNSYSVQNGKGEGNGSRI